MKKEIKESAQLLLFAVTAFLFAFGVFITITDIVASRVISTVIKRAPEIKQAFIRDNKNETY